MENFHKKLLDRDLNDVSLFAFLDIIDEFVEKDHSDNKTRQKWLRCIEEALSK